MAYAYKRYRHIADAVANVAY